jgi:hypothetical protein
MHGGATFPVVPNSVTDPCPILQAARRPERFILAIIPADPDPFGNSFSLELSSLCQHSLLTRHP